jgi:hypothetical protein
MANMTPLQPGDMTMFNKTKIALSAAIVLGTALTASAATKPQASQATGSGFYTMVPGYAGDGSVVAVPDPDHRGQAQLTGDLTRRND